MGSAGVGEVRQALGPPSPPDWPELEDILRLAHKLDAPRILKFGIGRYFVDIAYKLSHFPSYPGL